jgi:hypothetical protein
MAQSSLSTRKRCDPTHRLQCQRLVIINSVGLPFPPKRPSQEMNDMLLQKACRTLLRVSQRLGLRTPRGATQEKIREVRIGLAMSSADRPWPIAVFADRLQTGPRRSVFALAAVPAAMAAQRGLEVSIGFSYSLLLFYPTILIVSLFAGFVPGLRQPRTISPKWNVSTFCVCCVRPTACCRGPMAPPTD